MPTATEIAVKANGMRMIPVVPPSLSLFLKTTEKVTRYIVSESRNGIAITAVFSG